MMSSDMISVRNLKSAITRNGIMWPMTVTFHHTVQLQNTRRCHTLSK